MSQRYGRAIDWAILASLVLLNLVVIAPFLGTDFSSQPWNNDYTYIGMSRMFRDRPWSWNSLQYDGAPFRYLYPPLFHLLVMWLPVRSLGRAYHLVSAAGYAFAPAAFYVAALQLFRSRRLAAALAWLLSFSPTLLYYALPAFGGYASTFGHGTWNFVALIAANESAHTLSLALIFLVVAAVWRDRWLMASLCAAAIFLMNWPGMIGLLMALAALAVARSRDLGFRQAVLRIAGVVGAGYGLAAFWITPDCVYTTKLLDRIMLRHIQPSTPWNGTTWLVLACAAVLLGTAFWRRIPAVAAFVLALLAIPGAVVIAYNAAGNYLLPLPHRYAQEFNAAIVLALGCITVLAWKWHKPAGVLVLVLSALPGLPFLSSAWAVQQKSVDPRTTLAFQISEWLSHNAGSERVLVAGELEGAMNIWADVPQVSGSAQGVSNYLAPAVHRQITMACGDPQPTLRTAELWMRALDVRYLVVHGPNSAEHFHWFVQPEKFAAWPAVWTNGAGDTIYRVPPPDEQPAVVVDLGRMRELAALRSTGDTQFLESYVSWAHGKREARIRWIAPDRAEIETDLAPGEAVLVKINHDAGWNASTGTVSRDPIGFLLVQGAGKGTLRLRFGASWSTWLGRAITVVTILLLLFRAPAWAIAAASLVPAILAYGILAMSPPATAGVAERAYQTLQPPIINSAGIVDGATMKPPPLPRDTIVAIFGLGFGAPADTVHVRIGPVEGSILYRSPNQINLRMPANVPPAADVSVEVNGCRGNSFAVTTR